MKYPMRETSEHKKEMKKKFLEDICTDFIDSNSFEEFSIKAALKGFHRPKLLNVFWWIYTRNNIGKMNFSIIVMLAVFAFFTSMTILLLTTNVPTSLIVLVVVSMLPLCAVLKDRIDSVERVIKYVEFKKECGRGVEIDY